MTVQTYEGDCLEIMEGIPDASVDMVLCDPPYGTTENRWDTALPFDALWAQYHRIVRKGGAIVLFSLAPFSFRLYDSNPKEFRYRWIWDKLLPVGFLNARRAPLRVYEEIMVFCDRGPPYNPQLSPQPMRYTGKQEYDLYKRCGYNYGQGRRPERRQNIHPKEGGGLVQLSQYDPTVRQYVSYGRYPTDILRFDSHSHTWHAHPTQKPVDLCEYLIRTYTDEGMTVMDNTMGAGSTGVAQVQCGRSFIGIEKDHAYYDYAVDRIAKAERQQAGSLDRWF